jgi:hypothetical protein
LYCLSNGTACRMVLLVEYSTAATSVFIRLNLFRMTWRNLSRHYGLCLPSKHALTLSLLNKGQNGETYALKYGFVTSSFAALNAIDYSNKIMGDFLSVTKLYCGNTALYCMPWTCNVRAVLTVAKNGRL